MWLVAIEGGGARTFNTRGWHVNKRQMGRKAKPGKRGQHTGSDDRGPWGRIVLNTLQGRLKPRHHNSEFVQHRDHFRKALQEPTDRGCLSTHEGREGVRRGGTGPVAGSTQEQQWGKGTGRGVGTHKRLPLLHSLWHSGEPVSLGCLCHLPTSSLLSSFFFCGLFTRVQTKGRGTGHEQQHSETSR